MLRKQKAATNVQARLVCAEVYRDANPVCRCFRRPAEYTAGGGEGAMCGVTGQPVLVAVSGYPATGASLPLTREIDS
jgi:hypothetical protein